MLLYTVANDDDRCYATRNREINSTTPRLITFRALGVCAGSCCDSAAVCFAFVIVLSRIHGVKEFQ